MKKIYFLLLLLPACTVLLPAQSNILLTNPEAEQILLGNFDPAQYAPSMAINSMDVIAQDLVDEISPDSLKHYLEIMQTFGNRNTGSDTLSSTFGMGAARRWAFEKMEDFSARQENRMVISYLQFDRDICGMGRHKNVLAILPGQGEHYQEVVLVEGHLDSRCEDNCDVDCNAPGMEDNGSGSALVMELARVMSRFSFDRTIVFMLTTGEEQGLHGARAMSDYIKDQDIALRAVLNNDVIGGIICGETASPPGCPGLNHIDSINVRIYSYGSFNSRSKQLARFVKLEYQEQIFPLIPVKTVINIMTPEDRSGRGGDHIPFRIDGYGAVRFTSANEHGNGNPATPDYHDRQHTITDELGVDTDNDGILDSFFVDFNYLSRNAIINGNALAAAALGPATPQELEVDNLPGGFIVSFEDPDNYGTYRVAVRENTMNEWDTLIYTTQTTDTIFGLNDSTLYSVSVAAVDEQDIESIFSEEKLIAFVSNTQDFEDPNRGMTLLQNHPNPFDEATVIGVKVDRPVPHEEAFIHITDMSGREIVRLPISLQPGLNEVMYDYRHHSYEPGVYVYSLVVDGRLVESRQMIYAY